MLSWLSWDIRGISKLQKKKDFFTVENKETIRAFPVRGFWVWIFWWKFAHVKALYIWLNTSQNKSFGFSLLYFRFLHIHIKCKEINNKIISYIKLHRVNFMFCIFTQIKKVSLTITLILQNILSMAQLLLFYFAVIHCRS